MILPSAFRLNLEGYKDVIKFADPALISHEFRR